MGLLHLSLLVMGVNIWFASCFTREWKSKKQVLIKFCPSAFSPCNKVIQLGLVTSMPFPFLLEWYEISLLFTLEVMVAFLIRMHMEFDWLKLGPGP